MRTELLYQPVSTMAKIQLDAGESIVVEPSAMIGMSTNLSMQTGLNAANTGGGLLGRLAGAATKLLTGESFFQNTFTANGGPGEILLSHTLPGDMAWIELPSHGVKAQSSSYIASTASARVSSSVGGFGTFFSGEGLFVLDCNPSNMGDSVLLGAFGGIEVMECNGSLTVDTGHLVAWESTLNFNLSKVGGGFIASFLSGEGLVCNFTGHGKIWIQTRHPSDFGQKIGAMLPPRTN